MKDLSVKQRIEWLDIAKAFAIILVVFGHAVRDGAAQLAVYGFHVPLFFVTAGMSAYFSENRPGGLRKDFLRIMVPYYIWGIVSIGVYLLLGQIARDKLGVDADSSLGNSLFGLLYANARTNYMRYNLPLWFLPCLFVTKAEFYLLKRLLKDRKWLMFGCSVMLAFAGFVYSALGLPYLPFGMEISVKMLPLFMLGNCAMGLGRLWEGLKKKPVGSVVFGIALTLCAMLLSTMNEKINYHMDSFPNLPLFLFNALAGSCGVILISVGIGRSRALTCLGCHTLPILVMHKFPVLLFQVVGPLAELLSDGASAVPSIAAGVLVTAIAIGSCLIVTTILMKFCPFVFGCGRPIIMSYKEGD